MDAKPILCTATVLLTETPGTALAAAANLGETATSDAYAYARRVGQFDPITGGAKACKRTLGRRAWLCAKARCQCYSLRARRRRWHAVWLPGRSRIARRADLASV